MITFVRHRLGDTPNDLRKFAPLNDGHPALGGHCQACGRRFCFGDITALVALGPGDDDEERDKAKAGCWFNAVAILLHWSCASGRRDDEEWGAAGHTEERRDREK